MDANVKQAMLAALNQYAAVNKLDSTLFRENLFTVFEQDQDYLKKVEALDHEFDDQPAFESLREIFFDLLLINFFNEDVRKLEEDYLDSPEWEAIEDETIERGTELLNLLLYIRECRDEDIEPELGDFLREFLLVDEDDFQDEHRIYEDVIANQILVDSSMEEIGRVSRTLPEDSEIKDLFYPLIAFFRIQDPDEEEFNDFIKHSPDPDFDSAVYSLLISYNQ
jgi:hypothetical protein